MKKDLILNNLKRLGILLPEYIKIFEVKVRVPNGMFSLTFTIPSTQYDGAHDVGKSLREPKPHVDHLSLQLLQFLAEGQPFFLGFFL